MRVLEERRERKNELDRLEDGAGALRSYNRVRKRTGRNSDTISSVLTDFALRSVEGVASNALNQFEVTFDRTNPLSRASHELSYLSWAEQALVGYGFSNTYFGMFANELQSPAELSDVLALVAGDRIEMPSSPNGLSEATSISATQNKLSANEEAGDRYAEEIFDQLAALAQSDKQLADRYSGRAPSVTTDSITGTQSSPEAGSQRKLNESRDDTSTQPSQCFWDRTVETPRYCCPSLAQACRLPGNPIHCSQEDWEDSERKVGFRRYPCFTQHKGLWIYTSYIPLDYYNQIFK